MSYKKQIFFHNKEKIKKFKITYFFLIFFGISQILFSRSIMVKNGFQIFKNAGDGRSIALGNSLTSSGEELSAIIWNPAILSLNTKNPITYVFQNRFSGNVKSGMLAFPYYGKYSRPFGIVLIHESVNGIQDTRNALMDENGDGIFNGNDRLDTGLINEFSQHQWAAYVSKTWLIKNEIVGLGIKGIFHQIGDHFGYGIGFDLGFHRYFWDEIRFGIVLKDITTTWLFWDNGTKEFTPPRISSGISGINSIPLLPIKMNWMIDLNLNLERRSLQEDFYFGKMSGKISFGTEWILKDNIRLRFGENEIGIMAAGIGLGWTFIKINYAIQIESDPHSLGNIHIVSLSFDPEFFKNEISRIITN